MNPAPKHISEKKRFSLISRGKSFKYAIRGMGIILKTQHNFWIQLVLAIFTISLGVVLHISHMEWMVLVLATIAVLVAESFNTAIEIDIDLTSPEYHPYARDTKDVAAGAVLLSVLGALLIGCIIFIPKLLLFVR
ncbi:MAG: diacylglycerol kinase family protein [Candidatus Paceibacterota bacterium]